MRGDAITLDKKERLRKGQKSAFVVIIFSVFLALGKGTVGILSRSTALITDAVHTASDLVAIFASWFGLKIAQKEPDERFPFGYYKAENLATLFISVFILYVGIEFLLTGYSILFKSSSLYLAHWVFPMMVISIAAPFFMSRYLKKVGEEINSQSLLANAKERKADMLSSSIVLVAVTCSYYRILYVEAIITMIISILILKIGFESLRDSIFALMDISPSKAVEKEVGKAIKATSGIEDYSNLKLRKSGPFIFGEVDIQVKGKANIAKGHTIADNLENRIKNAIGTIDTFTVHIEPYKSITQKLVIPISDNLDLKSKLAEHFGRAKNFMVITIDIEKKEIIKSEMLENPYKDKKVRAGLATVQFLLDYKIDAIATKQIGEISFHTLRDNLVEVYKTEEDTANEVVDKFVKSQLMLLPEPTKRKEEG